MLSPQNHQEKNSSLLTYQKLNGNGKNQVKEVT